MLKTVLSSTSTSKRIEVRKRFFVAMAAALAGALLLHGALIYAQLGVPTRSTGWSYEINRKKLQRAASIQKPKLLLVGGSATLFGIHAELIEKTLNYPTVNMGTHAGLGIAYMLHLAKQAAETGDTVVLAFEYNTFSFGVVRRDPVFVDYIMARDAEYFRNLPIGAQFEMAMMTTLPRLRRGLKNRFKPEKPPPLTPIYHPSHLSMHGDQLNNEATNRPAYAPSRYGRDGALAFDLLKGMPAFENIREFVSWARANKVRVLATYPNIMANPVYQTERAKRALQRIQDAYAELQVPIIGSFEESLMPPSAFLDTHYHLTREGAQQRTERLTPHLEEALKRPWEFHDSAAASSNSNREQR
jgi:hypothetical protein